MQHPPVFGDVFLVEFPFADSAGVKQRPAVIVSSSAYHTYKEDAVILALTSKPFRIAGLHEVEIEDLVSAGLDRTTYLKATVTTVKRTRLSKRLGKLSDADARNAAVLLELMLGNNAQWVTQ